MRILLVTEFFSISKDPVFSGGVETRAFYIAKYLSRKHDVIVICRRRKGESQREKTGNLEIHRLGREVFSSVATKRSLLDRFIFVILAVIKGLSSGADIVEGSNFVSMIPAFIIGITKGIPKIVWYPDVLIGSWRANFGFILGVIGEVGERIFLNLPWQISLAISGTVAGKLIQAGVTKEKIKVIPCGVDNDDFKPGPKTKKPLLIVISRLVSYKRVQDAILAFWKLKRKYPDWQLEIIGDGPMKKNLLRLANSLNLNSVSWEKDLPLTVINEKLAHAHLLLHPSIIEGFGIVLVEAAAVGTPFIAANIPTSKWLAEKLKSGIVIQSKVPAIMAQQIEKLILNKQYYGKLRTAGLINSRQFSWDKLALETEVVYEEACKH